MLDHLYTCENIFIYIYSFRRDQNDDRERAREEKKSLNVSWVQLDNATDVHMHVCKVRNILRV